ncbi:DUF4192 family protein [Nocardia sp. NPDC048505]|uniref:DUF4192 family protein n=1 Tax=Nocardia sp. NPDC048505 TaxID=3155756 RepID=UPI0033F2DC0E
MFYNSYAIEFFARIPTMLGREPAETVVLTMLRDERVVAVVELPAEDATPQAISARVHQIAYALRADAVAMAAIAARRAAKVITAVDHAAAELPAHGIAVVAAVHVFDLRPGGMWTDLVRDGGGVLGAAT